MERLTLIGPPDINGRYVVRDETGPPLAPGESVEVIPLSLAEELAAVVKAWNDGPQDVSSWMDTKNASDAALSKYRAATRREQP